MKASTISWHLARDTCEQLGKFCSSRRLHQSMYGDIYEVDGEKFFQLMFQFDNGGFIRAELRAGDEKRGYTIADHFQVVDYNLGGAN